MAAVGNWWELPLPPGWERKFDPGSNRYFFLNHSNKQTQWEDPRIQLFAQLQTATQRARTPERTAAHPKPASSLQTGARAAQTQRSPHLQPTAQTYGLSQNQYETNKTWSKGNFAHPKPALTRPYVQSSGGIQMQEELSHVETEESSDDETSFISTDPFEFNKLHGMFPTAPEGLIKKVLAKNHNDHNRSVYELQQCGYQTSQGARATNTAQKVAIIKRLKQSFPQADQEMLDDVLSQCGGDEQKARRQLASLGYTSRGTQEPKRTVSPARPVHREPSPPRISEADKRRMFSKFEHDFKAHPKSIIQMALDASGYDETKTRILLQSMESPKERARTSRNEMSPSRATGSAESSRQEPASVSGVVVTVTTPDSISRPGTSSSTISSSIAGSRPSSAQTRPSSADRRPSPSKQGKRQQQPKPQKERRQPAKQTQPQQPKSRRQRETTRTETRPARAPRMPERPAYVSPLRSKPNGPDAMLVQGPSKDNLLTDYVQEHGHQSDLAKGPDRSNLIRYTGLLSEGPQDSNREGPNPDLVQGPVNLNRTD